MKKISIAIDGPAGAGKSTVAKKVAMDLGFAYIDTGAMYRALTYIALDNKLNLTNDLEIANYLQKHPIEIKYIDGVQKIFVDGYDITDNLRTFEVTKNVSLVSSHLNVRHNMVELQRNLASNLNVVMDGRDIGTNVLPNADLKIFLTASIQERANRRYQELINNRINADYKQIYDDISLRDKQDSERKVNPLKMAKDAILIDSSSLTINDVVTKILSYVSEIKRGEN